MTLETWVLKTISANTCLFTLLLVFCAVMASSIIKKERENKKRKLAEEAILGQMLNKLLIDLEKVKKDLNTLERKAGQ